MKKYLYIMLLASIAISTPAAYAQNIENTDDIITDPFVPFSFEQEGVEQGTGNVAGNIKLDLFANLNPLENYPLSNYRIIGTIVSNDKKIAAVKARDRHDYFVTIGDRIGKEGGIINEISVNGIKVSVEDRIISIIVRNTFETLDDENS